MLKTARRSSGPPHVCRHPWTCFVQCGGRGIVFKKGTMEKISRDPLGVLKDSLEVLDGNVDKGYTTAFFEAFPDDPETFIRAEGDTICEAEERAWAKLERFRSCLHDGEWEKRGYTNGLGFCCQCGMSQSSHFAEETSKT